MVVPKIGSKTYFNSVIEWVSRIFINVEREMKGLEWGRLYTEYKGKPFDPQQVSKEVQNLYADPYVKKNRGIFEYILGGSVDTKLLEVRIFDDATKRSTYNKQKN